MIRIKDRIKSIIYRMLRSNASTNFNSCSRCKKYRRNYWNEMAYKPEHLIGYDNVLSEWVVFKDTNVYAKVWIMSQYITEVHLLDEKLWGAVYPLCSKCITKFFASSESNKQ